MGRSIDHSDDLKWYPRSWREHYGEEFAVFLQDRYGDGPVPMSARLSMIRCGTVERLRTGGIIGSSVNADRRIRGASLLVLCAWGLFVVAGAAFAKYTEHWPLATPQVDHRMPEVAMGLVRVAAAAGVFIVLIAGLVTLPALVALVRTDGWKSMWATIRMMVVSAAVTGTAAIVIVSWNAHLSPSRSVTTPWSLRAAGVVGGLLVVAALAVCLGTVVAIVYRLRLSDQVTRVLGVLAMAMSGALVLIFAGALTWWITTAMHAPWFFGSLVPRSPSSPAPLAMVVMALTMLSGLGLAGFGTVRIAVGMGRSGCAPAPAGRTE